MAYIRKLPSGKWQAAVSLPGGKRTTYTHPLKKSVEVWARDTERARDRGERIIDRAAGRKTLREFMPRWQAAQRIDQHTLSSYLSIWRLYIEPHLGDVPVAAITPLDVDEWQAQLERQLQGKKARTRQVAHKVLSSMMRAAVAGHLRVDNPCAAVKPPRHVAEPGRALTVEEANRLLAALPKAEFVEVMLRCGLRWSEAAALKGDAVDWLKGTIHVRRAMTSRGIRGYGKSDASDRHVPVPADLLERLATYLEGRDRDDVIFLTRRGEELHYSNWLRRTWRPGIEKADLPGVTPHDCRHTYASWLAINGVDLDRRQAMLGHATPAMAQRYTHLRPEHFDSILDAVPILSAHGLRTESVSEIGR